MIELFNVMELLAKQFLRLSIAFLELPHSLNMVGFHASEFRDESIVLS